MAKYLDIAGEISVGTLTADTISERTAGSGVVIDSLTIADGDLTRGDVVDPGDAGAIPVSRGGVCHVVTAGAETRTVADPARTGMRLSIVFLTDAGNAVVTFASPVNVAGNNTLTLADAGEMVDFVSVRDGESAFAWRVVGSDLSNGTLTTV